VSSMMSNCSFAPCSHVPHWYRYRCTYCVMRRMPRSCDNQINEQCRECASVPQSTCVSVSTFTWFQIVSIERKVCWQRALLQFRQQPAQKSIKQDHNQLIQPHIDGVNSRIAAYLSAGARRCGSRRSCRLRRGTLCRFHCILHARTILGRNRCDCRAGSSTDNRDTMRERVNA
jgi:hypothetical protein